MSLFRCEECGCIENTAPSNYWNKGDGPALCSECDPDIGKWHGMFPKHSAAGMVKGSDGFLYSQAEVDSGSLKFRMEHQGLKMEGTVPGTPEPFEPKPEPEFPAEFLGECDEE